MYCKKCGKQLGEGAAFCGNCGTPVSTQKQKAADVPGVAAEESRRIVETKVLKQSEKKKGGKKTSGILLLCFCLLLAVGAGGWILVHKINGDKLKTVVVEEEVEQKTEEIDKEDEKEKVQDAEKVENVEIQQEEPIVEAVPETEPVYHEDNGNEIHTYELIIADVTWTEAYYDCIARGGYLVRIDSEKEYQAILEQITDEDKGSIKFWLGGARSAADVYEYRWIYEDGTYGDTALNKDEPFPSYWLSGEPSFYDESIMQNEMYMNMFYVSKEERWVWNDVPDDLIAVAEFYSGTVGYICEYEE